VTNLTSVTSLVLKQLVVCKR